MKKILAVICGLAMLSACASKETGADLYGNAAGGWKDGVAIEDLSKTRLTKKFSSDVQDHVLFAFNSSSLCSEGKKILNEQVAWLKANPTALVVIEGRCDDRGTEEYNQALGERRANAVRQYLTSHGIKGKRIKTISYGKLKPVVNGSDEEAYKQNRRGTTVAY